MGPVVVTRGSIWWAETPDAKGRPFLVVSRDAANEVMARVLVAPITARIRGAPSELSVGADEGLGHGGSRKEKTKPAIYDPGRRMCFFLCRRIRCG